MCVLVFACWSGCVSCVCEEALDLSVGSSVSRAQDALRCGCACACVCCVCEEVLDLSVGPSDNHAQDTLRFVCVRLCLRVGEDFFVVCVRRC